MFELNANMIVVLFGIGSAVSDYRRRRTAAPYQSIFGAGLTATIINVGLGFVWYFALYAFWLEWASLAGFGVGILVGLLGTAIVIGEHLFANRRRRDWR